MAEARQTTIRFSEDMYHRLEAAGEVTGLPINSIVVVACLEWLDAHQSERSAEIPLGRPGARLQPFSPFTLWKRSLYHFDRFTDLAKQVLLYAQEEAELAGQGYIGDEHLLLGLLRVEQGRAARILTGFGVDAAAVRQRIETAQIATKPSLLGRLGVPTSHVKAIIEAAFAEARRLKQSSVDTEHILLGLFSQKDALAVRLLEESGVTADRVRSELEGARPD